MQISDLMSPNFFSDPYPVYDQMREAGSLVALGPGTWMTGSYAVVDALLRDRRAGKKYMERVTSVYGEEAVKGELFEANANTLLQMNPPVHSRLRRLLAKAFNAYQVKSFTATAESVADRLIDELTPKGEGDILEKYAYALPLEIICDMMDIPPSDGPMLSRAGQVATRSVEPELMTPADIEEGNRAISHFQSYFNDLVRKRRLQPGSDLISVLLSTEDEGESLTDAEIFSNVLLLFLAGHETTANMISNAIIALHDHPEMIARAIADESLWPAIVSECMRYDNSIQVTVRALMEDVDIDGHQLKKGDTIYLYLGAANRDPSIFDQPNRLALDRTEKAVSSMSFGAGAHFCLGARLAAIELEVALRKLATRLPDFELTNATSLQWRRRSVVRGVTSLRARW